MFNRQWLRFASLLTVALGLALPAMADNVTVSGSVLFSSLDGSALDHDHVANGVFTVDDGDLTVLGTINCNDIDKGTSACPMQFVVSGNVVLAPGSGIYAENRVKDGNGGDITITSGGSVTLQGTSGVTNGAIISSSKTNSGSSFHGGAISINAGGTFSSGSGSIISSAANDGAAGMINVVSGGVSTVGGMILAGPSRTVSSPTKYTGIIMTAGGANRGGDITIDSHTSSEPGLVVTSSAIIASQTGDVAATATVTLKGCDVRVDGLVASIGKKLAGPRVSIRSGTNLTIDSTGGSHLGRVRADSTVEDAGTNRVDLFARNAIIISGPASGSQYAVSANQGDKGDAGTINVISTDGAITASGNALSAGGTQKDEAGGTINVSAKSGVALVGASINAAGGTSGGSRAGGHINVRSYSGSVSWTAGVGDVRPVGSAAGVPSGQQGTIALTYCTTLTTTGTSFPTNGSPVGAFPTTAQTCSPAAPSLPSGVTLPTCNTPPVANNDSYTVAEGGTLNVAAPGVLGNDTDAENNPITAILVSGPAHASSFSLNADGSFNYVHDGSETSSDSFTYKASDGSSESNVATVNITITPVNDAPVANDDSATVAEGGTFNYAPPGVLSNDTDADGPALTAVLVSGPSHASSFVLNADGSYTYVHDGSETLSDSFTYKASDGSAFSNVATVHITITPVNDAPVANNDSYSVAEGGTLSPAAPGVLGNDTDVDSPSLTAVLVSGPAHASSFSLNADGSFTYVHDGSETNSDSFTYKASDGSLFSNVATVNITVTAVNDAPVAVNDAYVVAEGGTLNPAAPGVLFNDTDVDSPSLTAVLVSGPAHASSFSLNADGSFNYVHDGSETLTDSFTYKANDGSANSNTATVNIVITPVNDAPTAVNDAYSVNEGGSLNVNAPGVLGNDTDPDGPTISAILVSGPANAASFTFNADGSFSYVHNGSETISDSFTYKANDGLADSNVATVNITVNPVNDAPVAVADAYSVNEGGTLNVSAPGVLTNDSDVDSPSITAVLVSGPAHAAAFTLNADGSFNYAHDGSETTFDSFQYKANDGSLDSNTVTVSITVNAVNDAPVANDDTYGVAEGGTLNVVAPGVLTNDTDAENNSLTAVVVTGPAHASSFSLNADGSFNYVHDGSEGATDSFTYKANDGSADSNVATVHINVSPVNDAPVANNDNYTVAEGGTLNVAAPGVIGNDTDVDGPSLSATLLSNPAHASSFTFNADGSFSYTHDGSETLSDSFTYRVSDGSLNSNVATVNITVTPVNDAPVAVADAYSVAEGGTLNPAAPGVLGNDTDVDSPSLTAVLVSGPAHASSFMLNANGSFSYVHDGSETLFDSFTYKANDGSLDSNTVTVSITVTPVNDAPVANNDTANVDEGGTLNVAAPGVLGNDTDAENDSLTAVLVSGPAHAASFSLNADGSYIYVHDGSETTSDSFTYKANDGSADSNVATVNITINPVNDAPVLANGSSITYTENDPATAVNTAITISDVDSANLVGATIQITGNYASGQDVLSYATALGITGSFNSSTGTLTLSGTSSVANYQTALRNVKYSNTSDDPSTAQRTVVFQVNDGGSVNNLSNTVSNTVSVTAVNDPPVATAYSGLPAQASIPITYPAGKLNGTDVEAGTTVTVDTTPINLVNIASLTINANGSFTMTPVPQSAGGTASFQYRVSDDGNPPPGVSGAYATVSFNVAGPAIYFSRSVPVGSGNCTLGNECTVTTAVANIGSFTNASIFVSDANSQSIGSVSLNSGGSIIGQGVTAASFDSLYGIGTPSQGVLAARPAVNQPRPTLSGNVTMNNNSQTRGFNLSAATGNALTATLRSGLVVTEMNVTIGSGTAVDFNSSSGTFAFGTITATGSGAGIDFSATTSTSTVTFGNISTSSGAAATIASSGSTNFTFSDVTSTTGTAVSVNTASGAFLFHAINANGATRGISVTGATGSFTVTGTSTTAGSGGTIQNCSVRGAEFVSSSNVVLKNMNLTGNGTGGTGSVSSLCGDALNQSTTSIGSLPTNCQANLYLQSSSAVSLDNVKANNSREHGIWGNDVTGLTLTNVEARQNGDEFGEDGVQLVNQKGVVTVTGGTFKDNATRSFEIQNNSGSPTVNITGAAFGNTVNPTSGSTPSTATAGDTILLATNGTNGITITSVIKGSSFNNIFGRALNANTEGNTSQNVTFGQSGAGNGNTVQNVSYGTDVNGTTSGAVTYSIANNAFTNVSGSVTLGARTVINARKGFGASGNWSGTISGNTIGTVGVVKSGCDTVACGGIATDSAATAGNYDLRITNNSVARVNGHGIDVDNLSTGTMRATITGNVLQDPEDGTTGAGGNQGSGVFVSTSSAGANINVKAGGSIAAEKNSVTGNWGTGSGGTLRGVRFSRGNGTTFCVSGFSGPFDSSSVATYITSQNTGNNGSATQPVGQTGFSGPSCPTP
jgi:VCBS repeat-containing protein